MKYAILILTSTLFYINGYSQTEYIGICKTDTIYNVTDLQKYVGQDITLIGEVRNSKIPTLNGVDIQAENIRGKRIIATGILIKTVLTEKDVDHFSTNRGTGTFYHLKNEKTRKLNLTMYKKHTSH